jgi:hypothetical protein
MKPSKISRVVTPVLFINLPAKRPLLGIGSPYHVAAYAGATTDETAPRQVPPVAPEVPDND